MQKMCLRCPVYMLCIPEHGKVVCKYAILNIASRWQQCTWLANTSMQHRIKLEHDPQSMQSVLLVFSLLSSSFAIHMYTDTCTNTLMYHTSNSHSLFFDINHPNCTWAWCLFSVWHPEAQWHTIQCQKLAHYRAEQGKAVFVARESATLHESDSN